MTFNSKEEMENYFNKMQEEIDNEFWYEKVSDFFEYTIWKNGIKEMFYNIKWYIKNRILFNKILVDWRPWDSKFQMELFAFGLEQVVKEMENGHEERTSANKKIVACKELIRQLRRDVEDEMPWNKEKETLHVWSNRYNDAVRERYKEIYRLMVGQDPRDYKLLDDIKDQNMSYNHYVEWFDGTGIEGWWN